MELNSDKFGKASPGFLSWASALESGGFCMNVAKVRQVKGDPERVLCAVEGVLGYMSHLSDNHDKVVYAASMLQRNKDSAAACGEYYEASVLAQPSHVGLSDEFRAAEEAAAVVLKYSKDADNALELTEYAVERLGLEDKEEAPLRMGEAVRPLLRRLKKLEGELRVRLAAWKAAVTTAEKAEKLASFARKQQDVVDVVNRAHALFNGDRFTEVVELLTNASKRVCAAAHTIKASEAAVKRALAKQQQQQQQLQLQLQQQQQQQQQAVAAAPALVGFGGPSSSYAGRAAAAAAASEALADSKKEAAAAAKATAVVSLVAALRVQAEAAQAQAAQAQAAADEAEDEAASLAVNAAAHSGEEAQAALTARKLADSQAASAGAAAAAAATAMARLDKAVANATAAGVVLPPLLSAAVAGSSSEVAAVGAAPAPAQLAPQPATADGDGTVQIAIGGAAAPPAAKPAA